MLSANKKFLFLFFPILSIISCEKPGSKTNPASPSYSEKTAVLFGDSNLSFNFVVPNETGVQPELATGRLGTLVMNQNSNDAICYGETLYKRAENPVNSTYTIKTVGPIILKTVGNGIPSDCKVDFNTAYLAFQLFDNNSGNNGVLDRSALVSPNMASQTIGLNVISTSVGGNIADSTSTTCSPVNVNSIFTNLDKYIKDNNVGENNSTYSSLTQLNHDAAWKLMYNNGDSTSPTAFGGHIKNICQN
jgi:hypothetical protein